MTTLVYGGELIPVTCWCGIGVAIPADLYNEANRLKARFAGVYCPLGHSFVFTGESEAKRYERLYRRAEDARAAARADADRAEASRRAWKGQTTKLRNRVTNGQCPFCGKYLVALDVHIARLHPDEKPRDLTEADATA